jgi:hypothetical protein
MDEFDSINHYNYDLFAGMKVPANLHDKIKALKIREEYHLMLVIKNDTVIRH